MLLGFLDFETSWKHPYISDSLREGIDWIRSTRFDALGDYPSSISRHFANIHSYITKPVETCEWECHRHTIDIQFMLDGEERIQWGCLEQFSGVTSVYNEETDRVEWPGFREAGLDSFILRERMFVVFLPGEPHRPMISVKTPERIIKGVLKITDGMR